MGHEAAAAVAFTRWYLALFFVGVASFYTIRIILAKRRLGHSPVFAGTFGSAHWLTHSAFRLFRLLITLVCLARLAWPHIDPYLLPFAALWHPAVILAGDVLLLVGFVAVLGVHFYMGSAWRSGTRPDQRTPLITDGPFAICRNPMMVFVMIAQLGFFMALPSAFSLICLAVGVGMVVLQVRVEERALGSRFGAAYQSYVAQTPRWPYLR